MDESTSTANATTSLVAVTVRIHCNRCHDVDVPLSLIRLTEIDVPGRSWYSFQCPQCLERTEWAASANVCRILRDLVATERIAVPPEALEVHLPVPVTPDEVLDALLVLNRSNTPADLLRAWVLAAENAIHSTDTDNSGSRS